MNRNRLILVAIAALIIGGVAWRLFDKAPTSDIRTAGAPIVRITVPELSAEAKTGKAAFDTYCATCHGRDAAGQQGIAPPLIHKIYEPGHHSDASFFFAAQQGVRAHHWPFGDMPAVDGISDQEIGRIIVYVRTLQRANGIN
ncbi:c-type cytochrome [Hoeflea poritis]|uniref:Cytochrome c n=1 Tax=Hoeflea poritis TaxID=2993659 RepID=A0ABT4VRT1_9HYPH|nr:cytochrome c [Hoeflea poritis]MDA4847408.1 cytochrome c [Hoeflea poritis]